MNLSISNSNKQHELKFKDITLILATLAFAFYFFSATFRLFYSGFYGNHITTIFMTIFQSASCILFLLYLIKFHTHKNAQIFLTVILMLIVLFSPHSAPLPSALHMVINIALALFVGFGSSIKWVKSQKNFTLILSSAIVLMLDFISLVYVLARTGIIFVAYGTYAIYFASLIINATFLWFGLKNKIPTLGWTLMWQKSTPLEKELKLLKEKLDLGILTQEEYQIKRSEMIKKI